MTAAFLRITTCIAALAALPLSVEAAPKFAGIFTDHAVLQRGEPLRIWGTTAPASEVTVSLNGQSAAATADAAGKWQATLPALQPGGPYVLSAADASGTTQLNDILIGDVFLCGGQSNMEFPAKLATGAWGKGYLTPDPTLRFVMVARDSQAAPLSETATPVAWKVAGDPDTAEASAVCYHMAAQIQSEQKVPVGMIDSYWGGTVIEAWISEAGLRGLKTYDTGLDALKTYRTNPQAARDGWMSLVRNSWQASEPDAATKIKWIDPKFNDADWKTMTPGGGWEASGDPELSYFDGILWYRQTVTLTAAEARNARRLTLGPVDDADLTWVNGQMVGNTNGWDAPRNYDLAPGVLKAGKNVIVVRATDTGGGGGFSASPAARTLVFADGTAKQLPAEWRYRISGPIQPGAPATNEPWQVPNGLTNLYNAMIAPLAPYNLKAVAWYQGEANAGSPREYARLLPTLFSDWRQQFQKADLPFLVVQLANYGPVVAKPGKSSWAELRESQRLSVAHDPHAGLAVTIDIGDPTDIHPTGKAVVGQRLALAARSAVYGLGPVASPEPVTVTRTTTGISITFKNTGKGLQTYSSDQAIGFEVCTASNACTFAPATVSGETVTLTGAAATATLVRYAWADSPYVNLYNSDNLPVAPFQMEIGQMEIAQ